MKNLKNRFFDFAQNDTKKQPIMLTFGFLFTCVGAILILFNTVTLSFVKGQVKSKRQALVGCISLAIGLVLLIIAIKNLMQVE